MRCRKWEQVQEKTTCSAQETTHMHVYCEGANSFRLRMYVWRTLSNWYVMNECIGDTLHFIQQTNVLHPCMHHELVGLLCFWQTLGLHRWSTVEWDSRLGRYSEDKMTMHVCTTPGKYLHCDFKTVYVCYDTWLDRVLCTYMLYIHTIIGSICMYIVVHIRCTKVLAQH